MRTFYPHKYPLHVPINAGNSFVSLMLIMIIRLLMSRLYSKPLQLILYKASRRFFSSFSHDSLTFEAFYAFLCASCLIVAAIDISREKSISDNRKPFWQHGATIICYQRYLASSLSMMQAKGIHLLSILMMIALLYWTHAQPLDPVDECLFSCDYCFKGEVLLNCANECLLRDNGMMGSEWTTLCPAFGLLTFDKR